MAKATRTPTDIEVAYQGFVTRIAETAPSNLAPAPDADDLRDRAQHLSEVLQATLTYSRAIMADTRYVTHTKLDDSPLALFSDIIGDLTGAIISAANRVEEAA